MLWAIIDLLHPVIKRSTKQINPHYDFQKQVCSGQTTDASPPPPSSRPYDLLHDQHHPFPPPLASPSPSENTRIRNKNALWTEGMPDQPTDGRTNGRTSGWTAPLIEMRGRIKKEAKERDKEGVKKERSIRNLAVLSGNKPTALIAR